MIYYKIGKMLKESGKSYRALAKESGLAYMTIVKLIQAKSQDDYDVGAYSIDKLCAFFKCKPEDLIYYKKT